MSRLEQLLRTTPPTTVIVVALCSVLHVLQMMVGPPLHTVTLSPRLVVGLGDYYRIITSALYHGDLMHIAMNMFSMFAIGAMVEKRLGTLALALTILYSIFLTSILYIAVAWIGFSLFDYQQLWYQHSVGFSGVLFHLSVLECHYGPLQPRNLFGIISVSPQLYPWVLLVVLQFIIPHLSFMGHLAGILVGTAQVHGYLDALWPVEGTLRDLDAGAPSSSCTTSFVTTQTTTTSTAAHNNGLGRLLGTGVTLVKQFLEALGVIIFGRGHRLNANIAWSWPSRTSNESEALSEETLTEQRSRLTTRVERQTEMV